MVLILRYQEGESLLYTYANINNKIQEMCENKRYLATINQDSAEIAGLCRLSASQ